MKKALDISKHQSCFNAATAKSQGISTTICRCAYAASKDVCWDTFAPAVQVAWVLCMVVDYISGSSAAMKAGQWSSAKARGGIWHKAGMIVVVIVAAVADNVLSLVVASIPGTYFGSNIVYFGFGYARGGSTSYSTAQAWFSECFIGSGIYAVCQKAGTYILYLGGGGSSARRYTLYVNGSAIPYDGFGAYRHLWAVTRQLNAGDRLYVTGYHSGEDSSAVLAIAKA